MVNKVAGYKARKSFFIIELPEYKLPSLWGAFKSMCARGWAYIVKAATIILLCNTAVQIMQTFTWSFTVAEEADASILATIASPFAYLMFNLYTPPCFAAIGAMNSEMKSAKWVWGGNRGTGGNCGNGCDHSRHHQQYEP